MGKQNFSLLIYFIGNDEKEYKFLLKKSKYRNFRKESRTIQFINYLN